MMRGGLRRDGGGVAGGFECTLVELDLIGAALGVDVRRFPLEIPIPADREGLLGEVRKSLTAKGLVTGSAFAPSVRRLIEVFTHGRVAIALLGTSRNRSHRVRAVVGGRVAVVATQRAQSVRFTPVRAESVVRQVVGTLSPLRPGPGSSVTVRAPAAAADFSTRSYLEPVRPPVGQATQILRRPRTGSGYVTVTSVRGDREGEPSTVSWVDTDAGRYAAIPTVGLDGRLSVTYTPADLPKLEQIVTRLLSKLT